MRDSFWVAVIAALAFGFFVGCDKLPGFKGEEKGPETGELPAPPIEGSYVGSGTNPDGTSYNCDVEISKYGDGYKVVWYFDGRPGYEGVGILKDNAFIVGFAGPEGYGVIVYTIGAGGALDGIWTAKGDTATGTETLRKK